MKAEVQITQYYHTFRRLNIARKNSIFISTSTLVRYSPEHDHILEARTWTIQVNNTLQVVANISFRESNFIENFIIITSAL